MRGERVTNICKKKRGDENKRAVITPGLLSRFKVSMGCVPERSSSTSISSSSSESIPFQYSTTVSSSVQSRTTCNEPQAKNKSYFSGNEKNEMEANGAAS